MNTLVTRKSLIFNRFYCNFKFNLKPKPYVRFEPFHHYVTETHKYPAFVSVSKCDGRRAISNSYKYIVVDLIVI